MHSSRTAVRASPSPSISSSSKVSGGRSRVVREAREPSTAGTRRNRLVARGSREALISRATQTVKQVPGASELQPQDHRYCRAGRAGARTVVQSPPPRRPRSGAPPCASDASPAPSTPSKRRSKALCKARERVVEERRAGRLGTRLRRSVLRLPGLRGQCWSSQEL